MAFSPRTVGDLLPVARFQFTDDNGVIVSIAGQNLNTAFQVILVPKPGVDQPGVVRIVGGGVFSYVTDGSDGQLNYFWVAGDVAVAGQYNVYCVATITNKPLTADAIPLTLLPKP
jgi:hypothetical protein